MMDFVGNYGGGWRRTEGVLTEHLDWAARFGYRPLIAADGTATIDGLPVLCSELVVTASEDGPGVGRCGIPALATEHGDLIWCLGHTQVGYRDECPHGLSAALCAGPGHYPMDR